MNDLKKFYKKYENEMQISWPIIIFVLILSFGIYWLFSKYGLTEIFNFINDFVKNYPKTAYLLAFISAFVEGTIILALAPGTMAVLIFGAVMSAGGLNIFILFPLVVVGAFLGDNLGYFLGRKIEKGIFKTGLIDPLQYKIAENFLKDHGGKAIFTARFINGIKELVPFIAGTVKMEQKKFQFFNFLGAIGWAILWLGLGYFFYENLEMIEKNIQKIFTILGIIFFYFSFKYYKKNKDKILEL